jgi:hypothetical protein
MVTELHLTDLSLAELCSLETELGATNVKRLHREDAAYGHGLLDPITAIVIVSVATIEALAIWISKNRKKITVERDEM